MSPSDHVVMKKLKLTSHFFMILVCNSYLIAEVGEKNQTRNLLLSAPFFCVEIFN